MGQQAPNTSNLLSLLQSQQGLRSQESNASQLSASAEPTFANPNPTQQQQQNLLNVLSMGDQQQQQVMRACFQAHNVCHTWTTLTTAASRDMLILAPQAHSYSLLTCSCAWSLVRNPSM